VLPTLFFFLSPNNNQFWVQHQDVHISSPCVGDIVTFSYKNNNNRGAPEQPIVIRKRNDLLWSYVVSHTRGMYNSNNKNEKGRRKGGKKSFKKAATNTIIVPSWKETWKQKAFFDSFAAAKGIDPLNPESWYRVSWSDVLDYNNVCLIYYYYAILLI
jgi:hypothetical protein